MWLWVFFFFFFAWDTLLLSTARGSRPARGRGRMVMRKDEQPPRCRLRRHDFPGGTETPGLSSIASGPSGERRRAADLAWINSGLFVLWLARWNGFPGGLHLQWDRGWIRAPFVSLQDFMAGWLGWFAQLVGFDDVDRHVLGVLSWVFIAYE